jgi:ketosteroid isomerase-like protein
MDSVPQASFHAACRASAAAAAHSDKRRFFIMRIGLGKVLASTPWMFPSVLLLMTLLMLGPMLPASGTSGAGSGQDSDDIRRVLTDQQEAWNRGDLDAFLVGYWHSDATAFAGTQGIVRGWQGLRERYRKGYPDRRAMGTLTFSELEIAPLCSEAALVLGHWHLGREAGPVGGVFSLVLRRFPEGWRIIADHTSSVPIPAPAGKP